MHHTDWNGGLDALFHRFRAGRASAGTCSSSTCCGRPADGPGRRVQRLGRPDGRRLRRRAGATAAPPGRSYRPAPVADGPDDDEGPADEVVVGDLADGVAAVLRSSRGCRPSRTRGPVGRRCRPKVAAARRRRDDLGSRYGSSSTLPSIVSTQFASSIVSPGRPITRLIRSRSCALDRLEHDDVAAAWVVQPVAELVDQDAVAVVQRGQHRRPVDREVLDDERPHHQRRGHRHGDDDQPLQHAVALAPHRNGRGGSSAPSTSPTTIVPGRSAIGGHATGPHGVVPGGSGGVSRGTTPVRAHSEAISFSTRSSRLRAGPCTARCAGPGR